MMALAPRNEGIQRQHQNQDRSRNHLRAEDSRQRGDDQRKSDTDRALHKAGDRHGKDNQRETRHSRWPSPPGCRRRCSREGIRLNRTLAPSGMRVAT
jgi:hypothetical protein